jgi:hypothetical protein
MDRRAMASQLAFWLAQQRTQERLLDQARQDASQWARRLKLAREAGDERLMQAALERAEEARDRYNRADLRLKEAVREAAALRQTPLTDTTAFASAIERSRQAMESFEQLGIMVPGSAAALQVDADAIMRGQSPAPALPALAPPASAATPQPGAAFSSGASETAPPGTLDAMDAEILALANAMLEEDERQAAAAADAPGSKPDPSTP